MKLKTLKCPRCGSGSLRKEHSLDPYVDDTGVAFNDAATYKIYFRFVCGKCGFPGYSTVYFRESTMNSRWMHAVQDYKEGLYKGNSMILEWVRIPLKRRRYKRRSSPSASPDSQKPHETNQNTNQDVNQDTNQDI